MNERIMVYGERGIAPHGYYIEVNQNLIEVPGVIFFDGERLPETYYEGNKWKLVEKAEQDYKHELEHRENKLFDVYDSIINFKNRLTYSPGRNVLEGYYLEIDNKWKGTGRYIYTKRKLPPTARKGYQWILVDELESFKTTEEKQIYRPGMFVGPGYFKEVDLKEKETSRICFAKSILPPTLKKGYKWVMI